MRTLKNFPLCAIILGFLLFTFTHSLSAQNSSKKIKIRVQEKALSVVLKNLNEAYDISFSYNEAVLQNCEVSLRATFKKPEKAIQHLLKKARCKLSYKMVDGVFIIYEKAPLSNPVIDNTNTSGQFKGQVLDRVSGETLPFAAIQINDRGLTTDQNGRFVFIPKDSSKLNIKISHLGYYTLDTICTLNKYHYLQLSPKVIGLKTFEINAEQLLLDNQLIQLNAGLNKLNHQVATFLPGNSDNSLFNLLRLQPGVLATGEENKDYIVWGSYSGQTEVVFDGITLFNTNSFYDDLGTVNPLVIKDIEVHKGGYNVDIGDRVGGFVNITSKDGDKENNFFKINANNQTINGMGNLATAKNGVVQMSMRTTHYNLLSWEKFQKKRNLESSARLTDTYLKYSKTTRKGDNYSVSLLVNLTAHNELVENKNDNTDYDLGLSQIAMQNGASFFYGKKWHKGGFSNFQLSYSNLYKNSNNNSLRDYNGDGNSVWYDYYGYDDAAIKTNISEFAAKLDHYFPTTTIHRLQAGISAIYNQVNFININSNKNFKNKQKEVNRLNIYIKDNINLYNFLTIEPGVKLSIPSNTTKPYVQPRVNAVINAHKNFKLNAAYGWYSQLIVQNIYLDSQENSIPFWDITDDEDLPVLHGQHYLAGFVFQKKNFLFKTEAYHKTIHNLTRYKINSSSYYSFVGDARTSGLDFYAEQSIGKQKFWLAYTLSKTEERFDYLDSFGESYSPAPHDQLHEIKGAALFNFNPYYFSINYVHGSGIPNTSLGDFVKIKKTIPYSRLDIAFLYQFKIKKTALESGASITNLLNHYNVRYNNFSITKDSKVVYAQASPFTPTIFMNVTF